MKADGKVLEALCAPKLSYSHSDGRVEDKATFLANAAASAAKSRYLSLGYDNPTIRVVGSRA